MTKQLAEQSGEPLEGPVPTLKHLFIQSVKQHADKTAIVALHQKPDRFEAIKQSDPAPYLRWTYNELYEAAKRLAGTFKACGLSKGDPIAVLVLNGVEWPLICWAALLIECPMVNIDCQASKNPEVIRHMLTVSGAKAIIAWDAGTVATLRKNVPEQLDGMVAKFVASELNPIEDWQSLSSCLSEHQEMADSSPNPGKEEDVVMILFTSGTTSLPKGCCHTNRTLTSLARSHVLSTSLDGERSSVAHLANFHIFALIYNLPFWAAGSKVVYPAASFSPKSTLNALDLEQCTDMGVAPSHITQMIENPSFKNNSTKSLMEVRVGGAMVSPDILKACIEHLGSEKASAGFGMTEGNPTIAHSFHSYKQIPQYLSSATDISVGVPSIGAHARVCAPESRTPVLRGQLGELHIGGAQVIRGYLAGAKGEFYEDEKGPWLATGDQAKMLDNGEICIVGRFKDLIIRGGENIPPSRIEAVVNGSPDANVQVVAAPNEFSGEVPVAVVKYAEGATTSAESLREKVLEELGPTYALDEVINIKDLGMDDFPKTTTGKIQKLGLTAKVRDFVEARAKHEQSQEAQSTSNQSLESSLRQLWAGLLGIPQDKLSEEQSLRELADSLTTMQFRARLKSKLQKTISLDDLVENDTIRKQAQFLQDERGSSLASTAAAKPRDGPPQTEDMVHLYGDASKAADFEASAEPLLTKFELSWANDVEDIVPTQDLSRLLLRRLRPQSWNHRHAYLSKVSVDRLRKAVEAALTAHPMLRTLAMEYEGEPYHVVIRAGLRWWRHCISDEGHRVKDPADIPTYILNDPELDFACAPGPLFRIVIVHVESTDTAAFIYQVNHSIFDGISIPFFIDSLDSLLQGSPALERTSFKLWADTYNLYRDSAPAGADAAYHAKVLKDISKAPLWPNLRAPGCFKGHDAGWIDESTGASGDPDARAALDGPKANGVNGVVRKFPVPGIATIRQEHNVAAPVVARAAVAILNAQITGSDVGIFSSYQASRSWPFVQPWIAQRLPDAMDVDGPTFACCVNKITVDVQETVGELVRRVQDQADELNRHAHAPHSKVRDLLNHDDAVAYGQIMRRQVLNWVPGMGTAENQYDNLTKLQQQSRSDQALMWNCNLADSETLIVNASYDDAQLRCAEVEEALEKLGAIATAISQPSNWDSKISGVL